MHKCIGTFYCDGKIPQLRKREMLSCFNYKNRDKDECCVICLDDVKQDDQKGVAFNNCNHVFHEECMLRFLRSDCYKRCPSCQTIIFSLKGPCPRGSMTVQEINTPCAGFESFSTFEITYSVCDTIRNAYVPTSAEGILVMRNLIKCFESGLTFRLGTSLTTGRHNVITWAGIHHKTSLQGGSHGFPDASYLQRVSEEMQQFGYCSHGQNLASSSEEEDEEHVVSKTKRSHMNMAAELELSDGDSCTDPSKRRRDSSKMKTKKKKEEEEEDSDATVVILDE
eukprot:GDKK01003747.1.p1 GENE.GDKK01003747.1~~GDKK01003747.1.p1  ORF type:complete len:281 (-),score=42.73 GDKK01003747.1:62-904(-)